LWDAGHGLALVVVDDLDVVPVRVERERAVSRHARVDRALAAGVSIFELVRLMGRA
jgi:hypothetical protein